MQVGADQNIEIPPWSQNLSSKKPFCYKKYRTSLIGRAQLTLVKGQINSSGSPTQQRCVLPTVSVWKGRKDHVTSYEITTVLPSACWDCCYLKQRALGKKKGDRPLRASLRAEITTVAHSWASCSQRKLKLMRSCGGAAKLSSWDFGDFTSYFTVLKSNSAMVC